MRMKNARVYPCVREVLLETVIAQKPRIVFI